MAQRSLPLYCGFIGLSHSHEWLCTSRTKQFRRLFWRSVAYRSNVGSYSKIRITRKLNTTRNKTLDKTLNKTTPPQKGTGGVTRASDPEPQQEKPPKSAVNPHRSLGRLLCYDRGGTLWPFFLPMTPLLDPKSSQFSVLFGSKSRRIPKRHGIINRRALILFSKISFWVRYTNHCLVKSTALQGKDNGWYTSSVRSVCVVLRNKNEIPPSFGGKAPSRHSEARSARKGYLRRSTRLSFVAFTTRDHTEFFLFWMRLTALATSRETVVNLYLPKNNTSVKNARREYHHVACKGDDRPLDFIELTAYVFDANLIKYGTRRNLACSFLPVYCACPSCN